MANDIIKFGPFAISNDGPYLGVNIVTGEGFGERRTGIFIRADHAVDAFGELDEETGEKAFTAFKQRLLSMDEPRASYGSLERQYEAKARRAAIEDTIAAQQKRLSLEDTIRSAINVEAVDSDAVDVEVTPRKSARSTKKSD